MTSETEIQPINYMRYSRDIYILYQRADADYGSA